MSSAIQVRPLATIIGPRRPGTQQAAGVLRAGVVAPAGRYRRCDPRAIDDTDLDLDQCPCVRQIYRACDQAYGDIHCTVLSDARIAGQGSVVTRDGGLLRESATEFLAQGATPDGFTSANGDGLRLPPASRRIFTPVLLLKRPWWRNYGHWLIDSATALALAARRPMPARWSIVVGRQSNTPMQTIVADTIKRLAPGVPVLEHPDDEVWTCDELHYVSPLHIPPLFKHPEGLAALRSALLPRGPGAPPAGRRLFITRGAHTARRLDNEAELLAHASRHGYEVVQPEQFDLAGQIRLFHEATCVVGVKGAALANLLFCRPGASCLVLSPGDFPDPFFWDLASHAGVVYAELFGRLTQRDRPRSHNAFNIDPDRFAGLLPR